MKSNPPSYILAAVAAMALSACQTSDVIERNLGTEIAFRPAMAMPGAKGRALETVLAETYSINVTATNDWGDYYFQDVLFDQDYDNPSLYTAAPGQKYYWPGDGSNLHFTAYARNVYTSYSYLDYVAWNGLLEYCPDPDWMDKDAPKNPDELQEDFGGGDGTGGEDPGMGDGGDGDDGGDGGFVQDTKNYHLDFAVGYATANKDNVDGVPLTMEHLMTQIEIWGKNTNMAYDFEVTNIKIARVLGKGTHLLEPGADWDVDPDFKQTYCHERDFHDRYVNPDTKLHTPITLGYGTGSVLLTDPNPYYWAEKADAAGNPGNPHYKFGNPMLIPQEVTPWNGTYEDKDGAYIGVKLRITTLNGGWVYPAQPVDWDGKTEQPYAWVAVPFPANTVWQKGKKYVYILDFTRGAGLTDPEQPNPHPVLTGNISVTYTVADWNGQEIRE